MMTDNEKLRLAVEALRKYADSENWGHAWNNRFDLWWPQGEGYDLAQQTLKAIGENLCQSTKS